MRLLMPLAIALFAHVSSFAAQEGAAPAPLDRATRRVWSGTILPALPVRNGHAQGKFELRKVATGVYATVRADPLEDPADGNSVVIINDRDVVVVDANLTPSSARAVIAEIRKLTRNPVRYVVITHQHSDHHGGTTVYRDSFPGVEFVAHVETAKGLIEQGPTLAKNVTEEYPAAIARIEKALATGKRSNGRPVADAERAGFEQTLRVLRYFVREMRGIPILPATITVERELILHRGDRRIEIRFLGPGNTTGDLVVYLPKEEVLITGDLVVAPTPYAYDSEMTAWPATLRALKAFPARIIVPGHGTPQTDGRYIDTLIELITSVNDQVRRSVERGLGLDSVRKAVDLAAFERRLAGEDPGLRQAFQDHFVGPGVARAFAEAKEAAPGPRPAARAGHVMTSAGESGGVLVLGGQIDTIPQLRDTLWHWSGSAWRVLSSDGPQNRSLAAAAFDTRRRVMVVYGGLGLSTGTRFGDTWEWDGRAWLERNVNTPQARDHHAMAYDEARGQIVMYGGQDADRKWSKQTWTWNGTAWILADSLTGPPGGRVHHAMAFDQRRQRVVLYGGVTEGGRDSDETWEWNGARWERSASTGPGPRAAHRMAYDADRGVTVLFGGGDAADTWTWDGTRWELKATEGPKVRSVHAMAYDEVRHRIMLFAGSGREGPGLFGSFADVWEWDGRRWLEVVPGGAPP